ncbi:lipoyl(octanoyl) transferase 2 [Brevipalpus obovatus]|uniref:lipoyl(octanoyl) transferase 2 n=1 Tax=Brevipalpus obovatus TaxID=246614 RepID=UPI003D9FA254
MKPIVRVVNLGRISWKKAFNIQCEVKQNILNQLKNSSSENSSANSIDNRLLLVEHDPVYTIGIRRKAYENETLIDRLRNLGADFEETDRGGLITFHGPGQLTVYPILYLGNFFNNKSLRCYVHNLERVIIDACSNLLPKNLKISTIEELPGVWIDDQRKIAAIGVHGNRFVTTHGVAINCDVDLTWFDHIIPCGIEDKLVTSLTKELGKNFTIDQFTPIFLESFQKVFDCQLQT